MNADLTHGMECHWHPGARVVGYCHDCRVFVCRTCADLSRETGVGLGYNPIRCTDCQLHAVVKEWGRLRRRMWQALGATVVTLVLGELVFNLIAPGAGAVLAGLVVAYVVGSFVLGHVYGPIVAPWLVFKDLRKLRTLEERVEMIRAVQGYREAPPAAAYAPPSAYGPAQAPHEPEQAPPSRAEPDLRATDDEEEDAEFDPNTPTIM